MPNLLFLLTLTYLLNFIIFQSVAKGVGDRWAPHMTSGTNGKNQGSKRPAISVFQKTMANKVPKNCYHCPIQSSTKLPRACAKCSVYDKKRQNDKQPKPENGI